MRVISPGGSRVDQDRWCQRRQNPKTYCGPCANRCRKTKKAAERIGKPIPFLLGSKPEPHTHRQKKFPFSIPRGFPLPTPRRLIFTPIRLISRSLRSRTGVAAAWSEARRGRLWDRWQGMRFTGTTFGLSGGGERLWRGFDGRQIAHRVQARFRNTRNVRNRSLQCW